MNRHLDKNKLWFKFYIPSNLGLVNAYTGRIVIVIAKHAKKNNTKQNNCVRQKVSNMVIDFSNRDCETSIIYTASI